MEILDRVWMLVKDKEVCYTIGTSAGDVWRRVIEDEIMGTGITKQILRKQGWRARKVVIGRVLILPGRKNSPLE